MFDDIDSILEFEVDQPEYLQIVNGLRKPSDNVNWKLLLEYMTEQNRIYSAKNGLCEVCHSPLVEKTEYEEICGSRQVSERYWHCRNGCI